MDDSFFAYLQRMESLAFFSGFPLLYAMIVFVAGERPSKGSIKERIVSLLPFAYALTGTLYAGLQLKNLYADSFQNMGQFIQQPLQLWGILAILFWLPALAKRKIISLLHSLVFFYLLAKDLFVHLFASSADKNNSVVRNDMKLYTDSILLNLGALIVVVLIYFLFARLRKYR